MFNQTATHLDYASEPWLRIRADLEASRAETRLMIENPRMDHDQTQLLRGHIAAITGLLARADETLAQALEDDPERRFASSLLADS